MRLLRRSLARLAMITTLLGSTAAVVAATSPVASAAPAAAQGRMDPDRPPVSRGAGHGHVPVSLRQPRAAPLC